jgi:hypothetical protein
MGDICHNYHHRCCVALSWVFRHPDHPGREEAAKLWPRFCTPGLALSIVLGFLSFLFGGFVQKACVRACSEAWIATFNENWRPGTGAGRYGWVRYLPNVLGSKDSKVYRDERNWAIDEKWRAEEKLKTGEYVNIAVAPFRMTAAVMAALWVKFYRPIKRRYQSGVV